MTIDHNKLQEAVSDNFFPYLKTLAGIALVGFCLDVFTGIDATAFRGASYIFAYVAYIPFVFYQVASADAENKKYSVETANDNASQAFAKLGEVTTQRNECVRLASAWKEKADASIIKADALGTECGRLRASEQALISKVQTLDKLRTDAVAKIADEQAHGEKLVASAKRDARKPLLLPAELGTIYAEHRKYKGIYNTRSLSEAERGDAKAEMDVLKIQLDEAHTNFLKA